MKKDCESSLWTAGENPGGREDRNKRDGIRAQRRKIRGKGRLRGKRRQCREGQTEGEEGGQ